MPMSLRLTYSPLCFISFLASCLCVGGFSSTCKAQQVPVPTSVNVGTLVLTSGGGFGQTAGMNQVNGTAGANPGWTQFTYDLLIIDANSTNPATVQYLTSSSTTPAG